MVDIQPPDSHHFKELCFMLMMQCGGKVLGFKEPQIATNFFDVEVSLFQKQLHILLNENYPFLAFASHVEYFYIHFCEEPELNKLFSPYYRVLGTKELSAPLDLKENELDPSELQQIAYWKPVTLGEVIFNFWD